MLTKEQKKKFVKDLIKKLKENKFVVFCNFAGISVEKQRKLKKEFKKSGGEAIVVKRRLLQKALSEEKIDFPKITGSVIMGLGKDEILPARIFYNFSESELKTKKEKVDFIGGVFKEKERYSVLDKESLTEIAGLSSKEDLLAKLIGTIAAPISNLNFILKGNLQKLVYIFANIRK